MNIQEELLLLEQYEPVSKEDDNINYIYEFYKQILGIDINIIYKTK